ncbi:MAG: pyrroloquinoline quinone precursor peptide PqqA [Methylocystis sp.]
MASDLAKSVRRPRQSGIFGKGNDASFKVKNLAPLIILERSRRHWRKRLWRSNAMAWSQPVLIEICVGMEITSYESAEF